MKKIIIIVFIFILTWEVFGQTGIAAMAGGLYPGLTPSEPNGLRFTAGAGYELMLRHQIFSLKRNLPFHARYSIRGYYNWINLPNVERTLFYFRYLTIDLFTYFNRSTQWRWYGGIGGTLLNVQAEKDFLSVDEQRFVPEIFVGLEYQLNVHYNVFGELFFQSGSLSVRQDTISLNGLRFAIGATMFLTE